ncbi:putative bifunctional diguanylate cyclase/phosphodiesterase [Paenibacillus sp. NPDC058071]|uniref:putative bifunctional diguanylate cyclase/phosphodiesterase n=1 Tax=Paenibacillus sp. NPDC058071 TaxID=3346326 RepID=UPI0036DE1068
MHAVIGLADRKEAMLRLELAISDARVNGKQFVVVKVQFKPFYRMNEVNGEEYCARVLRKIEERLAGTGLGRKPSLVCRMGNNDLLTGYAIGMDSKQEECGLIAEALKHAIETPVNEEGQELTLRASLGAAVYPQDGRTSEQLMNRAESALGKSEEEGLGIVFYSPEDTEQINRWMKIEAAIRPALYERHFHLSYQPIYRSADGKLRGFEALIRWQHEELGAIDPSEFMPIAEQNGMVVPIGEWVIREACKLLTEMNQYGQSDLVISINISHLQLQDPFFGKMIANILAETGLAPSSIELDIKESALSPASALPMETLTFLRAQGIRIMLDDFGVSGSSLTHLKQLPINGLKVSKVFIQHIDMPGVERHIVEMLLGLAQKLGLETIACGVEYKEQYDLLVSWGCDYVQGYLLGKPMQPDVMDLPAMRPENRPRH